MISNCIFTWAITSPAANYTLETVLWIDFKLYFYVSNHKELRKYYRLSYVVNWFQIVFLREQSQGYLVVMHQIPCCELISNCIFTWAITRCGTLTLSSSLLWIDFKLYFYVSNHKIYVLIFDLSLVVNWFQIVFLREQSQGRRHLQKVVLCCELISNCIFTWAITRSPSLA